MDTGELRYVKEGAVAHFVIDNGKMNVLTPAIHKAFHVALQDFEVDPDMRVGLLYGQGYSEGRPFSAGDDIKNKFRPERTRQEELEAYLFLHQREGEKPSRPGWEQDLYRLKRYKPIVAAVSGYCLGAALGYLLNQSDIRIAAPDARLGMPEVAFGAAGLSGITRLAQRIAPVDAAWMALTGEFVGAEDAARIRLINEVVEKERLLVRAEEIAAMIARHPPTAVRVEMEALEIGANLSGDEATRAALHLYKLHRTNYEGHGSKEGFFDKPRAKTDG